MMPRRILICTHTGDVHALAVQTALTGAGADVMNWNPCDFPAKQSISLEISQWNTRLAVKKPGLESLDEFDAIWLRRIDWIGLWPRHEPAQSALTRRHCTFFSDRIFDLFGQKALWVNRKDCAARSEFKPKQLEMASRAGLGIPETLISNDPEKVLEFAEKKSWKVVAKPLLGEFLTEADGSFRALHAERFEPTIPGIEGAISQIPYIYQEYIRAVSEIRVTIIGSAVFAARIDLAEGDAVDAHRRGVRSIAKFALPNSIHAACSQLMKSLGLIFGCIDFLLTDDEQMIFLEINQAGQFLWLERHIPEHAYLGTFCALLPGLERPPNIHLEDVLDSSEFCETLGDAHPYADHLP